MKLPQSRAEIPPPSWLPIAISAGLAKKEARYTFAFHVMQESGSSPGPQLPSHPLCQAPPHPPPHVVCCCCDLHSIRLRVSTPMGWSPPALGVGPCQMKELPPDRSDNLLPRKLLLEASPLRNHLRIVSGSRWGVRKFSQRGNCRTPQCSPTCHD